MSSFSPNKALPDHIVQLQTQAVEEMRRKCTKLGFALGGTPSLVLAMALGLIAGLMSLLVMSALPFWGDVGTMDRLAIMQLVLLFIGLWLLIMPFVFFKLKHALLAEIVTVIYLVVIGFLSSGMHALLMMGVTALMDAGISF